MSRVLSRSPEECLRSAVDALGGLQVVGHRLRPELDPVLAGQWLAHCLTATCRDKLSLSQIVWIFQQERATGSHTGATDWAELCGYRITAIVSEGEALADLARQAKAAADLAGSLSAECLERMRHSGLKVDIA